MKRFFLLLSLAQLCWILTYCGNQSEPALNTPTTPTTSDTICFEADIQPLLRFNCARSGCHDASSATQGVVMEDYTSISAQVTANNLDQSALYNAIKSGIHQGVSFDQAQIELVQNWILQGAGNTTNCSGVVFNCDSSKFTYSNDVKIILDKDCIACHNVGTANGNVLLDSYDEVKKVAASGKLLGVVEWQTGFVPMPYNRSLLPVCERTVIKKWIENGMPNN